MNNTDTHSPAMPSTCDGCDAARAVRRQALTRLLPLWPHEANDLSVSGRQRVVRLLGRALREERCRGKRGHWAYDLARHAALAQHYRLETEALAALTRPSTSQLLRQPGACSPART